MALNVYRTNTRIADTWVVAGRRYKTKIHVQSLPNKYFSKIREGLGGTESSWVVRYMYNDMPVILRVYDNGRENGEEKFLVTALPLKIWENCIEYSNYHCFVSVEPENFDVVKFTEFCENFYNEYYK